MYTCPPPKAETRAEVGGKWMGAWRIGGRLCDFPCSASSYTPAHGAGRHQSASLYPGLMAASVQFGLTKLV